MIFYTLWAISALLLCGFIFVLQHYLRIILNLFLNVQIKAEPDHELSVQGQPLHMAAADGVMLYGKFVPANCGAEGSRGTVIFCHEFGSDHKSVNTYAGFLAEAGYNLVTFDFRNHGHSASIESYHCRHWASEFEVMDLCGVIDRVKDLPDVDPERIVLFGISRGAATAICAALHRHVAAIVSDGAFSTPQVLEEYMKKWVSIYGSVPMIYTRLPGWVYGMLRVMTLRLSRWRLGYRFPNLAKVLPKLNVPILFVHGERDNYISAGHARMLFERAAGPRQLYIAEGARHNQTAKLHPREYRQTVQGFLANHLGPTEPVAEGAASGRSAE